MTSNETYAGEFYCVKCKEKREAEGKVVVSENGRRMAKAVCPVCGTYAGREVVAQQAHEHDHDHE